MSLTMTLPIHIPVLRDEVVKALNVQPERNYVDATVGLGGHASAILKNSPGGNLLGIDADPEALRIASVNLSKYGNSAILVNDNFVNISTLCTKYSFSPVHGILFDLGVSSLQLETAARGFSFQRDAPLDMRFDPKQELTASDIVNTFSEIELANIIREYGEERYSRQIAHSIIVNRPINTTSRLAQIVEGVYGGRWDRIHPATKTFLALRLFVNHELENLPIALKQAVDLLVPGGRLAVISYHSLEDRVVKNFMKQEAKACICPPSIPVCQCHHVPTLKPVTKKVVTPSLAEIALNQRSRSARLRVAERI